LATGIAVDELARRAGAIDVEVAELRDRLAQRDQDKARNEQDRARTAAVLAEMGSPR
jgi:hypothetical protein